MTERWETWKEPVIPGNPKVRELAGWKKRTFRVSDLTLPPHRTCLWCFKNPTPTYRHTYCSKHCQFSCYLFCMPQVYGPAYLKEKQGWKCNLCPKSFKWEKPGDDVYCETDHIIPIFQGGTALGWDNIQLLCGPCHAKKTAFERRKF